MPWEIVAAVLFQGGIADAFGSTGEVRISRRLLLGGSTTLRGDDYGELLTLQDCEDHLALRHVYQPDAVAVDRQQDFQRFVDHVVLRQEAMRTGIVQVEVAPVSQDLHELEQHPERGKELKRVMQARGISRHELRVWIVINSSCAPLSTAECGSSGTFSKGKSGDIIKIINRRPDDRKTPR